MNPEDQSVDIEFDTAFAFNGQHITVNRSIIIPSVYVDDTPDPSTLTIESDQWQAITGFSGQHGYDGPIMHPSEQFSPNVLRSLYETHGTNAIYALTEVIDADDPDALVGWAILKRTVN